ncbi:MAG: hypothetical protein WBZ01_15430 [Terriglobales bacterium]
MRFIKGTVRIVRDGAVRTAATVRGMGYFHFRGSRRDASATVGAVPMPSTIEGEDSRTPVEFKVAHYPGWHSKLVQDSG